MLTHPVTADPIFEFAAEVRSGLTRRPQKELPSRYLYDDVGSTLFEVISVLPEYGLTRADERLLRRYGHEIAERVSGPVTIAELGSGSGKKTRWILEAFGQKQHTSYYPIEISAKALAMCERELGDIDAISVVGFEREYLDGLLEVAAMREPGQHLLVLFLGSTIGNFDRDAAVNFLFEVRHILQPGDSMLLGTDLLKPVDTLIQAYDDPLGVTAAFNLNLLARINRELEGNFRLNQFRHEARFNPQSRSIEMHIRSVQNQLVEIPRAQLSVTFQKDETIWTESSHKFRATEICDLAKQSGFRCEAQWIDKDWPFAENLLVAE